MARVNGKDEFGDKAYLSVAKENEKICISSSEGIGKVFLTKNQAKELVEVVGNYMSEL